MKTTPSFKLEQTFSGLISGVDEAGCGPWAGPVVAGAVIFTSHNIDEKLLATIHDSKKLSAKKREEVFTQLKEYDNKSLLLSYGIASVEEIDQLNISEATKLAMQRAVDNLAVKPDIALVDGIRKPKLLCPVQTVIKGDQLSYSIAAASIVAKVIRDQLMRDLDTNYPHYGWAKNAGYGTASHQKALQIHGITPHHRRSFKPIAALLTK